METRSYPDKKELETWYREQRRQLEVVLEKLEEELLSLVEESGIRASVKGRVKAFESYYAKLLQKLAEAGAGAGASAGAGAGASADSLERPDLVIRDLLGVRILTPFLESVASIEKLVRERYPVLEIERKGEDQSFREFGYRSVHLYIALPESFVCELQIRTILQDAWAEVEHELVYKGSFSPFDEPMKRKLAALNATLSLSDIIFQEIRDYQRKLNRELQQRRENFDQLVQQDLPGSLLSSLEPEMVAGLPQDSISDLDTALLTALQTHNRGAYQEAVVQYGRILSSELKPEIRVLTLVHRGMARLADADYQNAEYDFLEAVSIGIRKEKPHYYLGILYRVTGRYRDSLEAFLTVLESDPYHFDSLLGAATAHFECGDYAATIDFCDRLLRIAPDSEKVLDFRRLAVRKLGL